MQGTVLIADDDRSIRTVLTQAFSRAGCKVRATSNTATLWRWVEEGEGDVVISDVMMPDGNGLELIPLVAKKRPDLPVIVISAQNTLMTAIQASEAGAHDYLPKPFDLKELLGKVSRLLKRRSAPGFAEPAPVQNQNLQMIGSSEHMQKVYRIFARVLNSPLNVIVMGESGTGKTLFASSLHDLSDDKNRPFASINCATASGEHLSEILLGTPRSPSAFHASRGGTLVLEDISTLSGQAQVTLLNILQSEPVASWQLRCISTSQNDVMSEIEQGHFREDLFYRLNVIPVTLPSLRDRTDDIAELAVHFLARCLPEGEIKSLSKEAMALLRAQSWGGNLRELDNLIQRLAILCTDDVISGPFLRDTIKNTPGSNVSSAPLSGDRLSTAVETHIRRYFDLHGEALPAPGLYGRVLAEVELPLIALTLSTTRGNQIKAAEILGINRNTLRKKIRDLDIEVTRSKKMM